MVLIPVRCPYCQSVHVIQGGKTDTDKHRYRCRNPDCSHQSFLLNSAYKGRSPQIKQQVIDMGRVSHLLRLAKTVMIGPEGETPNGRGSDKVSALSE